MEFYIVYMLAAPINNLWSCVPRGQFEEMCSGLLAKVEGPLRSVMEQASEYMRL